RRALPRRRQRRDHDCTRRVAACDLRTTELCLSARPDRRAGADDPGGCAAAVRLPDRCDGKPRADRLVVAEPGCGDGAVDAARRARAILIAPILRFTWRGVSRTTA